MIAERQVSARVVAVDDDRLLRELVRDAIGERAHVECCESAEVALATRSVPTNMPPSRVRTAMTSAYCVILMATKTTTAALKRNCSQAITPSLALL